MENTKYKGIDCSKSNWDNWILPCEKEIFSGLLNVDNDEIVVIYDAKNEDDEWQEEIYELSEMNLPNSEEQGEKLVSSLNTVFNFWKINTKLGLMYMTQDASPLAVWMTKEQASKLDIEYENS